MFLPERNLMPNGKFDITRPYWKQNTFIGRWRHFISVTNPSLAFYSTAHIEGCRSLLADYARAVSDHADEKRLRHAHTLCLSALHPQSGELQQRFGRMCFQVPGGMCLIGAMLTFNRSRAAIVFWQWMNQSFNALVNYTNSNVSVHMSTAHAPSSRPDHVTAVAYLAATTSACAVALSLNKYLKVAPHSLAHRLVPLCAVLAANCVNIPLMRMRELADGVPLTDESGVALVTRADHPTAAAAPARDGSRLAAAKAVTLTLLGRVAIVAPPMLFVPLLLQRVHTGSPRARALLQTCASGAVLLVSVPLGCALFPQMSSVSAVHVKRYEPELHALISSVHPRLEYYYFNKGL